MTYYFVNTATNHVTAVYALSHDDAWRTYILHLKKKYPSGMPFFEHSLSDIREELEHDAIVTTEVEHIS